MVLNLLHTTTKVEAWSGERKNENNTYLLSDRADVSTHRRHLKHILCQNSIFKLNTISVRRKYRANNVR